MELEYSFSSSYESVAARMIHLLFSCAMFEGLLCWKHKH